MSLNEICIRVVHVGCCMGVLLLMAFPLALRGEEAPQNQEAVPELNSIQGEEQAALEVVAEKEATEAPQEEEALNSWYAAKFDRILSMADENPLADLREQENAVSQKQEEEEVKEEEEVRVDPNADKREKAREIARSMRKLRHEHARIELRIKMSLLCRDCKSCACSNPERAKYRGICHHSIRGEIVNLQGWSETIRVSYDLPYSTNRLVQVNNAINEYRRQSRDILKKYKKLDKRLEKLGFSYADFKLEDKAETARIIPPRN